MWYEEVLSALQVKGRSPRRRSWLCLCPAHDDHRPSLEVWVYQGCLRAHCYAGCSFKAIQKATGIPGWKWFDPETRPVPGGGNVSSQRKIVCTYDYLDEEGKLVFQKVRYDPKGFSIRRMGDKGKWIWDILDSRTYPYNLPGLIRTADQPNKAVWVTDGEKDALTLGLVGAMATCSPFGMKWQKCLTQWFVGRHVIICPDDHPEGYDCAYEIAGEMMRVASSIQVLCLFNAGKKQDVTDLFAACNYDKELFKRTLIDKVNSQPRWKPFHGKEGRS